VEILPSSIIFRIRPGVAPIGLCQGLIALRNRCGAEAIDAHLREIGSLVERGLHSCRRMEGASRQENLSSHAR
jgi:hypothetical protein